MAFFDFLSNLGNGALDRLQGLAGGADEAAGQALGPQGAFMPGAAEQAAPRGLFGGWKGMTGQERLQTLGSGLQDVGSALDGGEVGALQALQKKRAAADQQFQLQTLAQNLPPQERLAFMLNPEEYGKQLASRYGARQVTGGNTVDYGYGAGKWTAPKMVESDGVYGTQMPGTYTQTGQRSPSYGEIINSSNNAAMAADRQVGREIDWANVGIARDNAASNRIRANKTGSSGGGGGAPSSAARGGAVPPWKRVW